MDAKDLQFTNIGKVMHIYIAGNLDFPPDIAEKINVCVKLMRENETLKNILDKWGDNDSHFGFRFEAE